MKMEKEEIIERLKRFESIKILYGNTFAMTLEQLDTLQNDIKAILNLVETENDNEKNTIQLFKNLTKRYEKTNTINVSYSDLGEPILYSKVMLTAREYDFMKKCLEEKGKN